jgi:hypothetical protein
MPAVDGWAMARPFLLAGAKGAQTTIFDAYFFASIPHERREKISVKFDSDLSRDIK